MGRRVVWIACGAAAVLATALSIAAVWWAPVNVDEEVTMAIAPRSPGTIWSIVWGQRGGGPLHFFVEHLTLQWPGGLVGLRVPSLVFFLATLPATVLLARELAGKAAAIAAVVLLAAAPLAVSYATFGRPHTMLMAWIAWGLVVGIHAARDGSRWWWIAAGLVLSSSVLVHPIAPVFAGAGLVCALVYAPRPPRALVREAWPGVLAFALVLVPYWIHSVIVLRDRYGVGGGRRGRTYSGNSVLYDAITGMAPTTAVVNLFSVLAVVGGVALLVQRRARAAFVPVLMVAAPILFFWFVPTSGRSALFFARYMLPALPLFLILVGAGLSGLCGLLPRGRWVAFGACVVLAAYPEVRHDERSLGKIHGLNLGGLREAVAAVDDPILFGATGTIGIQGHVETLSYGRPPVLADQYVRLRIDGIDSVDDSSCVPAVRFARSIGPPRRGVWIFYGARPEEVDAGARALPTARRVDGGYLVVVSRPLPARALLAEGIRLRQAWAEAVPRDFKVPYLLAADRTALNAPGSCRPLGEFGDPDITPARKIPRPT